MKNGVKFPDYTPRTLGPPNRGKSGSRAIYSLSRAEPQWVSHAGYRPSYAQQQARARRWRGARLERDDALRDQALSRLEQGWSPEQVAGRLALEAGVKVISHESIYRFIYGQMARKKDYA